MSLLGGLVVSKDPIFPSMVGGGTSRTLGLALERFSENWKEKERDSIVKEREEITMVVLCCVCDELKGGI